MTRVMVRIAQGLYFLLLWLSEPTDETMLADWRPIVVLQIRELGQVYLLLFACVIVSKTY